MLAVLRRTEARRARRFRDGLAPGRFGEQARAGNRRTSPGCPTHDMTTKCWPPNGRHGTGKSVRREVRDMLQNRPILLVVLAAGLAFGLTLGCPSVDPTGGGSSGGGSSGGGSSGGGSGGGSSGGGSSDGGGSGGSTGFPSAPRSPTPSDGARNVAVDFWSRLD